jgi:hypothetical protein
MGNVQCLDVKVSGKCSNNWDFKSGGHCCSYLAWLNELYGVQNLGYFIIEIPKQQTKDHISLSCTQRYTMKLRPRIIIMRQSVSLLREQSLFAPYLLPPARRLAISG